MHFLRFIGPALLVAGCLPPAFAGDRIEISFSGPMGSYSLADWKKDWPGCKWQDGVAEGNLSVVQRGEHRRLHVSYRIGEIGPEKNGCGWRYPLGTHSSAELRYTVRFSPDFDWVKGGKLPGLCGGPENVSGGRPADGTNGFSARLMWRADGRGEAYLYHKNQPDRYGDRLAFPDDFRFPRDTDIEVRMRVTMNEPGKKNGEIQVWIRIDKDGKAEEREVLHQTDLEWRTVESFGIDSLYFETFYGGSDRSWAPESESSAEFGNISVHFAETK